MENSNIYSSQITFLNFKDYERGRDFAENALGLSLVYDIGWAAVYRTGEKAFLGVVDHSLKEDIGAKDGVLVSLTTEHIEQLHSRIYGYMEGSVSDIKEIPDAGLRSFFFTGPEGFSFEIEQFLKPELKEIF